MSPSPVARMRVPVVEGTYRVTSGFGPRNGGLHRGIDFASNIPGRSFLGAPILAAADGTVIEARGADDPDNPYWVSGFGCWIWLRHLIGARRVDTIYGHMLPDDLLVKAGQKVRAGQHISNVGNKGDATGGILHFEVWESPGRIGGLAVDPAPWLGL